MVDMVAKAKALILGLLASAATTAATVDLTLPPGDYMLVPVQPYTVVTIQSTPVDPPVLDTDGDGVNDDLDQCPDTPLGDEVDATGCTVVPPPVDSDGDGVPDDVDACPTEPAQTADGCQVPQPPDTGDVVSATGANMAECIAALTGPGWCEIQIDATSVFRQPPQQDWGNIGPKATWLAWTGAAVNYPKMWFHGGGHDDSAMIDVYEADLDAGTIERIYTPPPMDKIWKIAEPDLYAWAHGPELPSASHTYDGFSYDPETGLLILVQAAPPGVPRFRDATITPDDPRLIAKRGGGIYAFNPTDQTIKGVAPKSWRQLTDRQVGGGYPRSVYWEGEWLVGDQYNLFKARWVGDDFVVDASSWLQVPANGDGQAEIFDGDLYLRHNTYLWALDEQKNSVLSLAKTGYNHGKTLSRYGDKVLYWDGHQTTYTQDAQNNWEAFDWTGVAPDVTDGKGKVYSKWFKHPVYDDIFIGWASHQTGPLVYRHPGSGGVAINSPGMQEIVNASDDAVLQPGIYAQGAIIEGSKSVDFANADILTPAGNGTIVVKGGPHSLKNLKDERAGRTSVWAQNTPVFTLEGFSIANKASAVLTSNNGGHVTLLNGVIRDGQGGDYGQEHNIYAGEIDSLTVRHFESLGHETGGHLLKSRAPINVIEDTILDGGRSNHSRLADFPCGGVIEMRRVIGIQSPNADNEDLVAIAVENCRLPQSTLILEDTVWQATRPGNRRFLTTKESVDVQCIGSNVFEGVASPCPQS